jgi:kinetochore protein Nuf2
MKYRQSLPHPDLHDESFSNLKFFQTCQKFMKICGNSDNFGCIDLGAPTKVRFRRQLSAAINYLKYREDRLVLYAELHDNREELIAGLLDANQEKTKWNEMIVQAKADAETRWDEGNKMNADCSEMEREIAEENQLQRRLRGESEELKKEATILKDKIATAELALQEMDAEERKLLPKVVDSPVQLKAKLAELDVELSQEQRRAKDADTDSKLMESRVRNVGKAQNDVGEAIRLAHELAEDKTKFEQVSEEADRIQRAIDTNQKEVEKLEQLRDEHKAEVEQIGKLFHFVFRFTMSVNTSLLKNDLFLFYLGIETKTEDNREQNKIKIEEVHAALRTVNAQLLEVEKGRRDAKATLEQHQEDVKVIKTIMEEEKKKADDEIANIMSSFKEIEKVVLDRQEEFHGNIRVN